MNRCLAFSAFLLCLAVPTLSAEGAGGIEIIQVVGQDIWPFPGGSSLPQTTGSIGAVGGMGYGVDNDGRVIGGFGFGVSSEGLNLETSPLGRPAKGFHAGYGGTIQGWQHSWGPLVGLLTTRVGFGGAEWTTTDGDYAFAPSHHNGGFSILGTAGGQLGVTILPWFLIGVEAGVAGTLTFAAGEPFLVGYAPTIAVRLLWGSF